jgi:hypothetical protein
VFFIFRFREFRGGGPAGRQPPPLDAPLKLDTSESRSEIPGRFLNVVLEKNGDQLDRSCEK